MQSESIAAFYDEGLEMFTKVVQTWKGFESFVPFLKQFSNTYFEKMLKVYTPNQADCGYNVLNHGDLHIKNMQFKRSEGKIEDLYFVSSFKNVSIFITLDYFRLTTNYASSHRQQSILFTCFTSHCQTKTVKVGAANTLTTTTKNSRKL